MNKLQMNKKVINIIDDNTDLKYEVNDNEMLILNYFNKDIKNISINILQTNNSYVVINFSCLVKNNCDVNINGFIAGDNNRCVINLHALAEANLANIKVCVKANDKASNNEIVENLKGINENGSILFMPILEIDTNDVDAAHFATIGSFDKNELFYLQAKGLSLETAIHLLKRSFIYNLFSDEFKAMLNEGKEKDE